MWMDKEVLNEKLGRLSDIAAQLSAEIASLKRDIRGSEPDQSVGARPKPIRSDTGLPSPRLRQQIMRNFGNKYLLSELFSAINEEVVALWPPSCENHKQLLHGCVTNDAFVFVYDDNTIEWHGVPIRLEDRIQDVIQSRGALGIASLSLGLDNRYYIKLHDGRTEWSGSNSFATALHQGVQDRKNVSRVAFGPKSSWVVLWSDGSFEAKGIPGNLKSRLEQDMEKARTDDLAPTLCDMSLGADGEWFLLYDDHSVCADGLSTELYETLRRVREARGRVRMITFGDVGQWLVRFWKEPE
ncbi:MAG: hypothetical protein KVP17_004267 [Porospora cf. gigantea B]|nr:MAG: hypothetical protein KVP17_004267 [Porospora cf. gigantea B]